MKFTSAIILSAILASVSVSSLPAGPRRMDISGSLQRRQGNRGGFGGNFGKGGAKGGNTGANAGGNKASASSAAAVKTTAAAAVKTTTAAAAAATSAAATGGKGNGGGGGGGGAAAGGTGDIQSSLTLDPSVVQPGLAQNGQAGTPDPGQVASLTSSNNFINFCVGKTLTNGQQVKGGSCNPTPMGQIIPQTNMPSSKFTTPANLDTIAANKAFTINLAIKNMVTGNFVNPLTNYFAAPQTLQGNVVVGHSHVTIESITSLTSTAVTDPTKFVFFKGLNDVAKNGVLSTTVTAGLPAGVYKMSTINSSANHQPVLVAVAQHGSCDDAIYFTVK